MSGFLLLDESSCAPVSSNAKLSCTVAEEGVDSTEETVHSLVADPPTPLLLSSVLSETDIFLVFVLRSSTDDLELVRVGVAHSRLGENWSLFFLNCFPTCNIVKILL